ncbi:MAG: hypothetical protein ACLFPM_05765 [Candidatus Izemoplasmatales bacterium]
MKKFFCFIILMAAFIYSLNHLVLAGQINYLPGGKNYISMDNFEYHMEDSPVLYSIDDIMVKPDTDYVFSIEAALDSPMVEVFITYMDNTEFIDEIYFTGYDFSSTTIDSTTYQYYQFSTDVDTNYIRLEIRGLDAMSKEEASIIQIEEGLTPTGYEDHIQGTMIDTTSPYFQSSGTIISYVDKPITALEVQDSLMAYDTVDGDVSENIVLVNDGYSASMNTLGTYSMIFSVSDSSGNSTEVEVFVEVVDVLEPVFSDVSQLQVLYPNVMTEEDILSELSASDNYDGDISHLINLVSDDYSLNASIVGSYDMEFSVVDSSGNEAIHDLVINVVDHESPVITGESTIHVGYNQYYSESTIISGLSVSDNYDQSIALVVESNSYKDNAKEIGEYSVVISATDSSGNRTEKTIAIHVIDAIGPMIYFDLAVIQVYSDQVMTLPEFAELLTKTNELESGRDYLITVKYDSYTKHANTPGTYHLKLLFEDEFGEKINKDLEVKVVDQVIDDIYMAPEDIEIGFFEKYINMITLGTSGFILIASNVVWFLIHRKRII